MGFPYQPLAHDQNSLVDALQGDAELLGDLGAGVALHQEGGKIPLTAGHTGVEPFRLRHAFGGDGAGIGYLDLKILLKIQRIDGVMLHEHPALAAVARVPGNRRGETAMMWGVGWQRHGYMFTCITSGVEDSITFISLSHGRATNADFSCTAAEIFPRLVIPLNINDSTMIALALLGFDPAEEPLVKHTLKRLVCPGPIG